MAGLLARLGTTFPLSQWLLKFCTICKKTDGLQLREQLRTLTEFPFKETHDKFPPKFISKIRK